MPTVAQRLKALEDDVTKIKADLAAYFGASSRADRHKQRDRLKGKY